MTLFDVSVCVHTPSWMSCWMAVVAQAASVYWRIWRKPLFTLVMVVVVGAEVGANDATVGRWEGAALQVEEKAGREKKRTKKKTKGQDQGRLGMHWN